MQTNLELIERHPLLEGLNPAEKQTLAEVLTPVHFGLGCTIFSYGDPGDSLYFLCSGRVEFFHTNDFGEIIPLEEIGVGGIFGEVAVLSGGHRAASAVVTEEMTALALKREDLTVLYQHPEVISGLFIDMARRLRHSGDQLRYASASNANDEIALHRTRTEKAILRLSKVCGSVPFLALNASLYLLWVVLNTRGTLSRPFDPYPFNLLALFIGVEAMCISILVLKSQSIEVDDATIRTNTEFKNAEERHRFLRQELERLRTDLLAQAHTASAHSKPQTQKTPLLSEPREGE